MCDQIERTDPVRSGGAGVWAQAAGRGAVLGPQSQTSLESGLRPHRVERDSTYYYICTKVVLSTVLVEQL